MSQLIYDANNFLRRRFEAGSSLKQVWYEVRDNPGIVVFDGPFAKDRRKQLYPEYKAKRVPAPDFLYKQFDLFHDLCRFLPVACIRCKGWEADDVIATLIRSEPSEQFVIESTDVDFTQLPNVKIAREKPAPAKPEEMRLYKTLVGDQSDNIGGLKGFGKGAWEKLSSLARFMLNENFGAPTPNLVWGEAAIAEVGAALVKKLKESDTQLRLFWHIVGLWDVPMDEILAGTVIGIDDVASAEKVFKEYMQ